MNYEIIFCKEKYFWNIMVRRIMHMFSELFMIYYDTKCFDTDRIYAFNLTMFQWTLPVGVVRWCLWTLPVGVVHWYSVDPVNGG